MSDAEHRCLDCATGQEWNAASQAVRNKKWPTSGPLLTPEETP